MLLRAGRYRAKVRSATLREDAFRRFDASGLPHRRIEEWKYTDLRALMREAKPLAEPAKAKGVVQGLSGVEASRVAIVNGRYEPDWSDFNAGDPGITLTELFAFAAEQTSYRLGDVPGKDDTAFWLNTAFMTGGVVVRVKKGACVEKPVQSRPYICERRRRRNVPAMRGDL